MLGDSGGAQDVAQRYEGGIHPRFGVGDGFVVIIDEWASADHFQRFSGHPHRQAFIGSVGADPGTAGDHG